MKTAHFKFLPFDLQAGPILCDSDITVLVAGTRGGKTSAGAFRCVMEMIEQPGHRPEDIKNGEPYRYLIATRDFPLLDRVVLPMVLKFVPDACKRGRYHETKKRLLVNGKYGITEALFLSGKEPDTWGGLSANRAWLDEFAQLKEELFNEIQARLLDRQGKMLLSGTPRGPNWAYYRLYKPSIKTSDDYDDRITFFKWRTIDNPYIPRAAIERLRKSLPVRYFKRAFEASWDAFTGQVYDEFSFDIHVVRASNLRLRTLSKSNEIIGPKGNAREIKFKTIVAGVDWGYHNPGVIQVCGQQSDGKWYALETAHESNVLVTSRGGGDCWVRRARQLRDKWGISVFYCDPAEPEYMEQFASAGLNVEAAENELEPGIQYVASLLKPDEDTRDPRLVIVDDYSRALLDELPFYHYDDKGRPVKQNDHSCDGIRYALYTHHIRGDFKRELGYRPRSRVAM